MRRSLVDSFSLMKDALVVRLDVCFCAHALEEEAIEGLDEGRVRCLRGAGLIHVHETERGR